MHPIIPSSVFWEWANLPFHHFQVISCVYVTIKRDPKTNMVIKVKFQYARHFKLGITLILSALYHTK